MSGIRIVLPYRPFPPESDWHRESQAFDWIAAIRMLMHSVDVACRCPIHVITDVDTALPVPSLQYVTLERRLMLWYLEIAAAYLASEDFDRDTVMLDSDQLIYQDLAPQFQDGIDLTILIRTGIPRDGTKNLPILNGVQFWAQAGRDRLVGFYRRALAIAAAQPEDRIVWGADTDALCDLLEPLTVGVHERAGLRVRMIESSDLLETMSSMRRRMMDDGRWLGSARAVLDFRGRRKSFMRDVYERTLPARVVA